MPIGQWSVCKKPLRPALGMLITSMKDTDLDPLHDREDSKKLVESLRAASTPNDNPSSAEDAQKDPKAP